MGRKIFVSYKYGDEQVKNLTNWENSKVRDYVTEFERILDSSDNIYKGESDNEDLSKLDEQTIWNKLRDRIYDSSVTVVFISPGMKEWWKSEREQWIPWEISYSLKETSRKNKNGDSVTSKTNAMIAVILPDEAGLYSYYLERKTCCSGGCNLHHTNKVFQIIRDNKFNYKKGNKRNCDDGSTIWSGECSYISAVKWEDLKKNYNIYVEEAVERQRNIDNYEIVKNIK